MKRKKEGDSVGESFEVVKKYRYHIQILERQKDVFTCIFEMIPGEQLLKLRVVSKWWKIVIDGCIRTLRIIRCPEGAQLPRLWRVMTKLKSIRIDCRISYSKDLIKSFPKSLRCLKDPFITDTGLKHLSEGCRA